jgi:hypothetical protein
MKDYDMSGQQVEVTSHDCKLRHGTTGTVVTNDFPLVSNPTVTLRLDSGNIARVSLDHVEVVGP